MALRALPKILDDVGHASSEPKLELVKPRSKGGKNKEAVVSTDKIAAESGLEMERVSEPFAWIENPVSLETPVADSDSMYGDLIQDKNADIPETVTAKNLRTFEIAEAMCRLNHRMHKVRDLRYGLSGDKPRTLEEVAQRLGVSRERVRQLEACALRELQSVAPGLPLYLRGG